MNLGIPVRESGRIVAFAVVATMAALVVNLIMAAAGIVMFGGSSGLNPDEPSAERVAAALDRTGGQGSTYVLADDVADALDAQDEWAMVVDATGEVVWSRNVPDALNRQYGLQDVASFSRWYLDDYPVTTWVYEDGIMVVGAPPDTIWKYPISFPVDSLGTILEFLALLTLVDFVLAVVVGGAFARRRWKRRDEARTEWVAAVSHDVRTPLSVVMAEASALADARGASVEDRRRAERIVGKAGEMSALISDLNAANRLRYAMQPVDASDVCIAAVVRGVVVDAMNDEGSARMEASSAASARNRVAGETLRESAADVPGDSRDADGMGAVEAGAHAFELAVEPDAEGAVVRGSEKLLRRMVANLVGNAVRHNPRGCSIAASVRVKPGIFGSSIGMRCIVEIRDDGVGFGADELSLLKRRPGRDMPEHGLGLVIVRRIAHAHGGRARFFNNESGGSACQVVLPAQASSRRKRS